MLSIEFVEICTAYKLMVWRMESTFSTNLVQFSFPQNSSENNIPVESAPSISKWIQSKASEGRKYATTPLKSSQSFLEKPMF